jgi:23S rRNA (adenine2030-N6)-methyltransferase
VNYRHAFHAGNFADCMKHALLVALLRALQRKPGPIFVLDTHAGAGHYDLGDARALRSNEAASGILRLLDGTSTAPGAGLATTRYDLVTIRHDPPPTRPGNRPGHLSRHDAVAGAVSVPLEPPTAFRQDPPPARPGDQPGHHSQPRVDAGRTPSRGHDELAPLRANPIGNRSDESPSADPLADYLAQVRSHGLYPGSPELILSLLRPDDRLACCELHPEEFAALRRLFRRDNQVAVHHRDGWEALKALLPPVQKRGLVLIDPPFEDQREFTHLAEGLALARTRFPAAALAAWYPIKHRARERAFFDALTLRDVIACELLMRKPLDPTRLNGCGLLVVNPPYRFEQQAQGILDTLLDRLGDREPGEAALVARLADE